MLVCNSAGTAISFSNSEAKESLAQPRPHEDWTSIASGSLGHYFDRQVDIPIPRPRLRAIEALVKYATSLASAERISLALLDSRLGPVTRW